MNFSELTKYDYELPPELIRKTPLEPRDSARLFIYDTATDTVNFDVFRNVAQYLPADSLMVLNDTKVWPARLWLQKETGGKIEVFILVNEWGGDDLIPALVDRKVASGNKLIWPNNDFFTVEKQEENKFFLSLHSKHSLETLIEEFGETPIPHYLEGEIRIGEEEIRKRYQTIFATSGASVAAPTASLHFTDEVFRGLDQKGIMRETLTLNVGLGTFAPLSEKNFATKTLHQEFVELNDDAAEQVNQTKKRNQKIISVGTTVTRTLETLCQTGMLKPYAGPIDTFIFPPYEFQVVDTLVTNFHLPKTSLMLLVDAFLESKGAKKNITDLYKIAMENQFSFYSFGDSMLIL